MPSKCPACGKEIIDAEAIYCPHCSKPLKELVRKKTKFPIAGGILAIIIACWHLVFVISDFVSYFVYPPTDDFLLLPLYVYLVFEILYLISFNLGLTGGIMSLRRKNFVLSIVGSSYLLVTDLVGWISLFFLTIRPLLIEEILVNLLIALPVIVLEILSVIFVAISKKEFS